MKIRNLFLVFMGLVMVSPSSVRADSVLGGRFEVFTGSLVSLSLADIAGTAVANINGLGTGLTPGIIIGVPSPSIGYYLNNPMFEIVLSPNFNWVARHSGIYSTVTEAVITAGAAVNFFGDRLNAYFAKVELGFAIINASSTTSTYFALASQIGKRFALTESITWTPSIAFQYIQSLPSASIGLSLLFGQFSLML